MTSDVLIVASKASILNPVHLLLVVNLFCCLSWYPTVGCLPRLTASDSTGDTEGLITRHQFEAVIRENDDEIVRARQRLDTYVGIPQPTSTEESTDRRKLANHDYQASANKLRYYLDNDFAPWGIRDEIIKVRTPIEDDPEGSDCILGRAHHYMAHWLNLNGTINIENYRIRFHSLDLSHHLYTNIVRQMKPFLRIGGEKSLVYLSMANSGINTVPLFELTLVNSTLTYLSLMGNILIPFRLPVLLQLHVLDLRNCGLDILPDKAFVNTPNLIKLFLAHNFLMSLSSGHFAGLSALQHLDLSYIIQFDPSLNGGYQQPDPYNSLTEGIDLSVDVFTPLTNLSFLDVSHTKLLSYSARAFRHITVEQLSLCYTGIPLIVGSMMNGSLKVVDISGNPGITTAIHHDNGETRYLNFNVEILVCENSTVKNLEWLDHMNSLKILLLGTNNINQLTNESFAHMTDLELLDLSNNHISNWHQRVFESNEKLYILDLSNNNINVLTTEMLYDFASVNFLAIGHNSFVCHCLLREFVELAAKNAQSISCLLNNIVNHIQDPPDSPENENEDLFNKFSPMAPVNPFKSTTATHEKGRKPNPTEPLQELTKSTDEYNVFFRVVHSYVSSIYDSTTKFQESLDKYGRGRQSYRVYRKVIDARVQSRFFPINCDNETTVEPDTTTTQEGIPIDSEYPDFIDPLYGLQIQIIDFDEDRYKCIDLDDSEFYLFEQERCSLDRASFPNLISGSSGYNGTTASIIKFILMFFGFALLAFIIYISKWEYVKYFCIIVRNATILSMMKHKNESLLRKNSLASIDSCFMYDVFVSYSEQDRQWVLDEMLPNLEKTEDINVCLHERDFKVGVSILENIINCMDRSRTLLLVMSESFLLSHWCQFEMHLAQHRLLETRRENLILVLLEDIPRAKRSRTLQFLMKTKTYINWPQPEKKHKLKFGTSTKSSKNLATRKEKDAHSLAEDRKLFWKRLRKAINDRVVWEPDIEAGQIDRKTTI